MHGQLHGKGQGMRAPRQQLTFLFAFAALLLATPIFAHAEKVLWLKYHFAGVAALEDARYDDAQHLLESAVKESQITLPPENHRLASTLDALGRVHFMKGEYDQSETYYKRALAMRKAVLGPHTRDVPETVANIGELLYAKGDLPKAERQFRHAMLILSRDIGNLSVCRCLEGMSKIQQDRGNYAEAEALLLKSKESHLAADRRYTPAYAKTLAALGAFYTSTGRSVEARRAYGDAIAIARQVLRKGHPDLIRYQEARAEALKMADAGTGLEALVVEAENLK
jgi:tetratricopeptide (TPR) repeat protein